MKNYRNIVIIFLCIFFSACEAEWVMDLEVNEDESGKYSISILLDQEAQYMQSKLARQKLVVFSQ